jgi:predicted permease
VELELHEELDFHLEMQARKHMAAGVTHADAVQRARAQFGSVELTKDDARDVRGTRVFEELVQDIRYAVRGFRRAPTFALTVVLTIAIGLGLNTTVFSIFNAYVLRPLEVRDPRALYAFAWQTRDGSTHELTWDEYSGLGRGNSVFSEILAQRFLFARIDAKPAFGELVSGNYFQMLGVGAALGRTILPEDASAPGTAPVIVLSHVAWRSKFGGDSGIIGRTVLVRGVALSVVGVAREGFGGLEEVPRDFWAPITMIGALDPSGNVFGPEHTGFVLTVGRLRSGMSADRAGATLTSWARLMTATATNPKKALAALLESRATAIPYSPQAMALLLPIVVAFAFVLIIACANVGNMMLARGMARQREIGIRLSLGAARPRLIRQLLSESVLLALPAALVGFVIAYATLGAGVNLMFATLPAEFAPYIHIVPLEPDWRVFAFILSAAVASAVLFGLAPALQATRASVVQTARGNFDSEHRPSRLRNALLVAQITAATLLLVCSGILFRNSHRLERVETGVRTRDVLQIGLVERGRTRALAQLRAEPAVETIAAAVRSPLDGSFNSVQLSAGRQRLIAGAFFNFVSSEYFPVLGIPLVAGRNFTHADEIATSPVAIVSEATARRFWPDGNAVGETITLDGDRRFLRDAEHGLPHEATVIGVARDAASGVLVFGTGRPVLYFPTSAEAAGSNLLIRVRGNPDQVKRTLDADLERAAPGAVEEIHKMDEFVAGALYPFHAASWVSSAIGIIALVLTLTGIYGVLSYLVTQRAKEIGIRLALGATGRAVMTIVLRQSLRHALIGLAAGSLLALGATRILSTQLEFLQLFDAPAYAGGAFIVLVACLGAAVVPSRRAARIDPMVTLRQD